MRRLIRLHVPGSCVRTDCARVLSVSLFCATIFFFPRQSSVSIHAANNRTALQRYTRAVAGDIPSIAPT